MSLVDEIRALLGEGARSHQLLGEDLARLPGAALRRAGEGYTRALEDHVPAALRDRFEHEQDALLADAHALLRRYSRSLHGRVRGYLEVARRCRFAYPWPVAAIVGITQVLEGLGRSRLYAIAGSLAGRLGRGLGIGLGALELLADGGDDVLRRTNRGIFADSVPTLLWGLRAHALCEAGEPELALALLEGPLAPVFDEECRAIARDLAAGLALGSGRPRFDALADLTRRHFGREQAIFSHHTGERPAREEPWLVRRALGLRELPAPVIERGLLGPRLVFRPWRFAEGFDLRAHEPRVEALTRAFIEPIVSSPESYRVAAEYVVRRFGRKGERFDLEP